MHWLKQLFSRRRRYHDLSLSIQEHLEEFSPVSMFNANLFNALYHSP